MVVVGGGQAGLAIGYFLARQGRDFAILEAADSRRPRGASAGTPSGCSRPRATTACPGLPFPGDPDRYPTRDEVVAYLSDYARHFDLPVELDSPVARSAGPTAATCVELDDRTYEADQVVVATGPFQAPRMPPIAERLDPEVVQLHSSDYRRPATSPTGRVLVVGGGNTGFQIAEELSRHARGAPVDRVAPDAAAAAVLGRDLFWYLDATGLIRKTTATRGSAGGCRAATP